MASVTLNGVTYTDDADPSTGLANGGHRTRFVPCLVDFLAEVSTQIDAAVNQVLLASAEKAAAAALASSASTSAAAAAAALASSASTSAAAAAASAVVAHTASANLQGTSASSVEIGAGAKNLTTQGGKDFYRGLLVQIYHDLDNYMIGRVESYDSGTGAIDVEVTSSVGTGTYMSWTLGVATAAVSGIAAYATFIA